MSIFEFGQLKNGINLHFSDIHSETHKFNDKKCDGLKEDL